MRPVRVEFQAFGPYAGYEMVDFDAVASKGLFLICGKTGIGKTMILDAMTFALYGKSSGHGRDDFTAMRCTNAAFEVTTFVKFEFENNGKYYIFERRLERKRKNLAQSYNVMSRDDNGVWQPLLENAKERALNELAVQIIGLEYDQFRQVIVLPQGQFERLLTSNSDEKEKILTNIFGEGKWQGIAEQLYNNVTEKKDRLKSIKDRIANSLAEEQCESVSQLAAAVGQKKRQLEELDREYAGADYDRLIKEKQNALAIAKRFEDKHRADERLKELMDEGGLRSSLGVKAENAKRAGKMRRLFEEVNTYTLEVQKREKEEALLVQKAEKAQENAAEALKRLHTHIGQEAEIEDKKRLIVRYEDKREGYEGLASVREGLEAYIREEKKAIAGAERARLRYEEYALGAVNLQKQYETLLKEHEELLSAYIAGIAGDLAKNLDEGMPCPVCGSRTHPDKARLSSESVAKEHVDKKKQEADNVYRLLQDDISHQEKAKEDLDKISEKAGVAHTQVALTRAKLDEMYGKLVPGIGSLDELDIRINELNSSIRKYNSDRAVLEADEKLARDTATEAFARIESAKKEILDARLKLDRAKAALTDGITENGFTSEAEARGCLLEEDELAKLIKRITDYDSALKSAKEAVEYYMEELKDVDEPDTEECNKVIDELTQAKSQYAENRGIIISEFTRLSNKLKSLKAEGEGIEEKIREAEEDFAFAKKLRGDSGTGLQRYVLGIMFSSVIKAANSMLEMVHDGRYRLFRSDAKAQGSNKRGLELAVFDRNSDEHGGRPVSTLSGGEKFLVSLALSIGMSNVAQKSGIRIEALFIDEGFGSLDENSINDAMNVLESIRRANGMVGIISHVQLLQDRVACKLQVGETDRGSHIVSTIG